MSMKGPYAGPGREGSRVESGIKKIHDLIKEVFPGAKYVKIEANSWDADITVDYKIDRCGKLTNEMTI